METIIRWAILVEMVKAGQLRGLPIGHTLMQKSAYLLQAAIGVPLGYSYRIHYYGPYSEALWQDLTVLDDLGILHVVPQPDGYGYSITSGQESHLFDRHLSSVPGEAIGKVVEVLGRSDVKTLEIVATTHYAYRSLASQGVQEPNLNDETASAVTSLKPHIRTNQVHEALRILKSLAWL